MDRSIGRSIDCAIDRSIDRSIDWSIHRSINWSIDRSMDRSIHLSIHVILIDRYGEVRSEFDEVQKGSDRLFSRFLLVLLVFLVFLIFLGFSRFFCFFSFFLFSPFFSVFFSQFSCFFRFLWFLAFFSSTNIDEHRRTGFEHQRVSNRFLIECIAAIAVARIWVCSALVRCLGYHPYTHTHTRSCKAFSEHKYEV